ncbi:MAG: hypothetical protein HY268_16685 [Deltaproteobacteria bacterium]|nr:hypothetical protein [Deltaproteobacteria bacterium]
MRASRRAYGYITLTVLIFNLIGVFGPFGLLYEDRAGYYRFTKGFSSWHGNRQFLLDPLRNWLQWHVMAYSAYLMRIILVLLLMVPISCCFYYIYHSKFKFSQLPAFVAAVLPNILPAQDDIPAGLIRSYSVHGLLLSLLSLISGYRYLEESTAKKWAWLSLAVVCYFSSSQLMEQALFLFPPLALAFLGYTKLNRKHGWLVLSFFLVALVRFMQMIVFPRQEITNLPLEGIVQRIGLYVQWSFPAPDVNPLYLILVYVGIIAVGFVLYRKNLTTDLLQHENFSHLSKKLHVAYLYAFFICWLSCAIFVFICLSDVVATRYIYLSAFGLDAVLIFSVSAIVDEKIWGSVARFARILLLVGLVIFSGVSRYRELAAEYSPASKTLSLIVNKLNKILLPDNSQIVICGIQENSAIREGWLRGSGQLRYLLKRNDIAGLFVSGDCNRRDYSFADHFDPHVIGPNHMRLRFAFDRLSHVGGVRGTNPPRYAMTGIAPDRPVFLFNMNEKEKILEQLRYALQWKGETKEAAWTILQTDQTTGKLTPFVSGIGLEEYLAKIKELEDTGISQAEILWGGPLTEHEQKRLENPKKFPGREKGD